MDLSKLDAEQDYAGFIVSALNVLHEDKIATLCGDREFQKAANLLKYAIAQLQLAAIILLEKELKKLKQEKAFLEAKNVPPAAS